MENSCMFAGCAAGAAAAAAAPCVAEVVTTLGSNAPRANPTERPAARRATENIGCGDAGETGGNAARHGPSRPRTSRKRSGVFENAVRHGPGANECESRARRVMGRQGGDGDVTFSSQKLIFFGLNRFFYFCLRLRAPLNHRNCRYESSLILRKVSVWYGQIVAGFGKYNYTFLWLSCVWSFGFGASSSRRPTRRKVVLAR